MGPAIVARLRPDLELDSPFGEAGIATLPGGVTVFVGVQDDAGRLLATAETREARMIPHLLPTVALGAGGGPPRSGVGDEYRLVAASGDAMFQCRLAQPLTAAVGATGAGAHGWWATDATGRVVSGGRASHLGDVARTRLARPVVGMAATPSARGYWLVASDGGIFSFGDASFFGSTGAIRLNQPIVGMAPTPTGRGYWLVASDGGIFSFGDASFFGSTGAIRLNQPIVGMAPTPTGRGYWLLAGDGGVFTFGDAPFLGADAQSGATYVALLPS